MITEGCIVKNKNIRGTVGAVILYNGRVCVLTAGHVIRNGNGTVGSQLFIDGHASTVLDLINEHDLALVDVPREHAKLSAIGRAHFGPAELITCDRRIACRVIDTGRNLNRLAFPCGNMPLPGDSGSPVVQRGEVVALLSSVLYNNCTGLGISSEVFGNPARLK